MCYHNYTQHNGCGHIGESHTQLWTLCPDAEKRLSDLRGPMSPPLYPPASTFPQAKRTSSTFKLGKRFASFGSNVSRSTSTTSDRRSVSGPSSSRASTSSSMYAGAGGNLNIPDHQFEAVKCTAAGMTRRTIVSREMDVCKECKKWLGEMRFMIERFDKTGSVKGTGAFEEFLKTRGESEVLNDA